jgi:hypothetical protein
MSVDVLSFPAGRVSSRPPADLGYSSLSLLARLRDSLRAAASSLDACWAEERRTASAGVPRLFFFDRDGQTGQPAARTKANRLPEPYLPQVSNARPADRLNWNLLPALLDDALTLLPASTVIRRAARSLDGLVEAAGRVADHLPAAAELAELLAVPDDQVILAIHPEARFGIRTQMTGVADVHQLHALLSDLIPTDRAPGSRPDSRIVAAYRNADPDPSADVMTARFQFYAVGALQPNGTLPDGFAGTDHWIWGDRSPAEIPMQNGERVVLLGDAVYTETWPVGRKLPRLPAGLDVVEVLTRSDVERWLAARCPAFRTSTLSRVAA